LAITINNFNCLDTLANGDSLYPGLEAVLFEADPQNPCNDFFYNTLDCVNSNENEIVLEGIGLQPATTYYVMVDGAQDPLETIGPGQCTFDIDVKGAAIENEFDAGPDFEIDFGENVNLQPSGFGDSLSWTPTTGLISNSDIPSPLAMPTETTTYTLTNYIDGCFVSDSMTVVVLPTIIPYNAFTPNGDSHNDVWGIALIDRYPKADIRVYSRWGQPVYRSIGYNSPWDGTFNSTRLPAATYYYVIRLNDNRFSDDENVVTGSVAIVY